MSWWREGVLYQIYPRSFADADGDGVGDLDGIATRLDHLEWLGVDGLWLNPVTVSPNADWGYDVADYCDVDPALGDLAALDRLVEAARGRGIRIVLDLVPNHTSDRHPWFAAARSSPEAPRRDWYVWADPAPDGSPPNNWRSVFGGPAWALDDASGQYYLHNFLPEQPDLNWWNEGVRDAFDAVMRFWLDRGIAGFRIDVANAIVKDRQLRDNPVDPEYRLVYNANRPEVHDIFRRWRVLTEEYGDDRLLVGETWVFDPDAFAAFFGSGDELHLAFNFMLTLAPFEARRLREVVEATETALPEAGLPAWALSNHDVVRFPTRWCDGDDAKARCALLVLLGLRGTPFLYQGDELGLPQTEVPEDRRRDPVGRDGARTPMPWSGVAGAGFTRPGVEPWLPLGDHPVHNVEAQRGDPGSTLTLTRDLIALRRELPDLGGGAHRSLPTPEGVWAWRRGEGTVVAVNLTDGPGAVEGVEGSLRVSTDRSRDGEDVAGRLALAPWEGAVVSATMRP